MYILVINGPNLNMLGIREPDIYGHSTYKDLCGLIQNEADRLNVTVEFFQSNHEGSIVDKIQEVYNKADSIIINPAAYTHTSVAIFDALKAVSIPTCEVHISDVKSREAWRQISYVGMYAEKTIMGYGFDGYIMALHYLVDKYNK